MAVTHKTEKQMRVLVFAQREKPAAAHSNIIKIALVRRLVDKYNELIYNLQLSTIHSKQNFSVNGLLSVTGQNPLERDHFYRRRSYAAACSHPRRIATALSISVTIELNEIFKIFCKDVCWISRPRKGASDASAAVYARSADRQKFRRGQTDRWPESSCH